MTECDRRRMREMLSDVIHMREGGVSEQNAKINEVYWLVLLSFSLIPCISFSDSLVYKSRMR